MIDTARDEARLSVPSLSLWVIAALMLPGLAGALRPSEAALGALHLAGAWALGGLLLARLPLFGELPPLYRDGAALLVGGIAIYPACLLPAAPVAFAAVEIAALAVLISRRRPSLRLPPAATTLAWLVALGCSILLSVGNQDLIRALHRNPVLIPEDGEIFDALFSTAMVSTLRQGTISSASYEVGSPIAYQVVSGLPPAAFGVASLAPSHVAVWGVWMPLYKIIGLLLVADLIARFAGGLRRSAVWYPALQVGLYLLLQPLHPRYLARGDFRLWVWDGLGWIGAGMAITSTASIPWAALAVAATCPVDARRSPTRGECILAGASLVMLAGIKVAMFFPIAAALFVIALSRARRGDRALLVTLLCATPMALALYVVLFRGSAIHARPQFGYFLDYFAAHAGVVGDGVRRHGLGLLVGAMSFAIWGSIRWWGMAWLARRETGGPDATRRREAVAATLVSLLASSALACSAAIEILRPEDPRHGAPILDHNYNLLQFPRHAFLLVSVLGAAGLVRWMLSDEARVRRPLAALLVGLWCALSAVPLIVRNSRLRPASATVESWRHAAAAELSALHPHRIAIDPSSSFPGLLLAASDLGPFWVAQHRNSKGWAIIARWSTMLDALSDDGARRAAACRTLQEVGVDALVATDGGEAPLARFAVECGYRQSPGGRWVFTKP